MERRRLMTLMKRSWKHIKKFYEKGFKKHFLGVFETWRSALQKTLAHCGSLRRRHRKIHPSWSRWIALFQRNDMKQIVTTYTDIVTWLSFRHQGQDNYRIYQIDNIIKYYTHVWSTVWYWLRSDDRNDALRTAWVPQGPVCSQCPRKVNAWSLSLSTVLKVQQKDQKA